MAIWRGSVNTLAELQALDTTFLNENLLVFVKDEEKWYFWNSTSTEAISSPDVLGRSEGLFNTSLTDADVFLELEESGQPFIDQKGTSNFNEQTNTTLSSVAGKVNNAISLTASGSDVGIVAINKFELHTNQSSVINFWWKWSGSPTDFDGTIVEVTDSYKLEYLSGSFQLTVDDGVGTSTNSVAIDPIVAGLPLATNYVMTTIIWDHNLKRTTILMNLRGLATIVIDRNPQVQAGNNLQLFNDNTGGDHEVDHLGIWTRFLTARELQLLYDQGDAYTLDANDLVSGRWKVVSAGGGDTVKVSGNDTTPDFLGTKLLAGTNTTLVELNDGANENLRIDVTDELTKISSNDTTAGYLLTKLVAGTNITLNEQNDGGNETLEIVGSDELTKVSANDTTPDYLATKLVAGTNVVLTELNDGANETLEVATTDELVKVSANDTTPEFLVDKVVAGTGIVLTELNDGADESLEISTVAATNLTVKQSYIGNTSVIADLASDDITILSGRALIIGRIETDVPATVRLYSSLAAQTADSGRGLGVPPTPSTEGLVAEVATTGGNLEIDLSDGVTHINLEDPQLSEIYATVFNQSGGNSAVQVTLCAHVIGNVVVSSGDIQSFVETTAVIADLASDNIDIGSDKALLIGRISTDFAATVRLYNSLAARTADAGRALGVLPPPTIEGLITEVATTGGNLDIDLSPSVGSVNLENPQTQDIYATVFNQSGGNQAITVTLLAHAVGSGAFSTSDELLKVSANDTVAAYLSQKLVAGAGITLTEINDGFNETFEAKIEGSAGLQTFVGATSSIADQASEDVDITTGNFTKVAIARINTSVAALIRLYTSKANRTADAGRGIGVPAPSTIRGLVAEVETAVADLTIDLSNLPTHINLESTQVAEIYATIFNLSGSNNVVTLNIYGE